MENLTEADVKFILESLKYSKLRFEEYEGYPSEDFRKQRIDEVNKVIQKVKDFKT